MTSVALARAILTLLSLFIPRTPMSPHRRAVDAPAISIPPDTTPSSRLSTPSESPGPKKTNKPRQNPTSVHFLLTPHDHVPARYMPESRTVYDYPLYMLADPKKTRVTAKRTTLVLNFSPKSSGLSLDPLSVNYFFSAANAPTTRVWPVLELTLNCPATPVGSVDSLSAKFKSVSATPGFAERKAAFKLSALGP